MIDYYLRAILNKYFDFKTRASRAEYWSILGINILNIFFISLFFHLMGANEADSAVVGIYQVGVFVPSLAAGVRRMHDSGRPGWFLIVPFYNLYLLAIPGDAQANEYGSRPS